MRKIIMMFAAASIFAACSNNELETKKDVVVTDTSTMFNSSVNTDTAITVPQEQPVATEPKTRIIYVDRTPKTTTKKSVPKPATTRQQTQANTGAGTNTESSGTTTSTNPATTTTTTTPAEKEDKGWSSSTKGAVIGGVGGAVTGAILSKKKAKGAIIGGVIGAAGGYILGKKKDKAAQDTTK